LGLLQRQEEGAKDSDDRPIQSFPKIFDMVGLTKYTAIFQRKNWLSKILMESLELGRLEVKSRRKRRGRSTKLTALSRSKGFRKVALRIVPLLPAVGRDPAVKAGLRARSGQYLV